MSLLSSSLGLWLLHAVGIFRCFSDVVKSGLGSGLHGVEPILVRPAQKISCGRLTWRAPLLNGAARLQA